MTSVKSKWQKLVDDEGRKELTELGTNAMIDSMQAFGGLPTRNFREVQFEGTDKINPEAMVTPNKNGHTNLITNKACFGCTIACGRVAHIDQNHFTIVNRKEYWHASGGLEYETAYAFGPVCGVDDIDALTFAGYLMNEHGMDPISFGVTLAAAMELFEMGVITLADTDNVPLNFGNAEALTIMAEKTGKQEGFGKLLGLGSKRLCEKFGHPELSMSVKGQEFAGYDSRADAIATIDSTGLCLFTSGSWDMADYADQIDAACEGDWTVERLEKTGERIWTIERQFNITAGMGRADDTLPPRLLNDPAPSGTAKGRVCELNTMLDEYYELRGWDSARNKGTVELADESTVRHLIDQLNIPDNGRCHVTLNGALLQSDKWDSTVLNATDDLVLMAPISAG